MAASDPGEAPGCGAPSGPRTESPTSANYLLPTYSRGGDKNKNKTTTENQPYTTQSSLDPTSDQARGNAMLGRATWPTVGASGYVALEPAPTGPSLACPAPARSARAPAAQSYSRHRHRRRRTACACMHLDLARSARARRRRYASVVLGAWRGLPARGLQSMPMAVAARWWWSAPPSRRVHYPRVLFAGGAARGARGATGARGAGATGAARRRARRGRGRGPSRRRGSPWSGRGAGGAPPEPAAPDPGRAPSFPPARLPQPRPPPPRLAARERTARCCG